MPHQDEITPIIPSAPGPSAPAAGGGGGDRQAADGETIEDILAEYRALVRAGEADQRANRQFAERLERAGFEGGSTNIRAALREIFDAETADTRIVTDPEINEGGGVGIPTAIDPEADPFFQQELDQGDVFTRFLNETLGGVSPLIRNRAQSQFSNLANQFQLGHLGGIAGFGGDNIEDVLGTDPSLFANFLRGGNTGALFENDPSRALRNIGSVFGGEGIGDDPTGFINRRFNPETDAGRNRISGAITSPLLQSINPFFRNDFVRGFGSDLDRLLASDPGANPFSAFSGFFR